MRIPTEYHSPLKNPSRDDAERMLCRRTSKDDDSDFYAALSLAVASLASVASLKIA